MKLSVIIVTYLSQDLIGDCISSVFRFNDLDEDELEVIVVENSPLREATAMAAYLEERFGGKVTVLVNDSNRGYGHGNNLGISYATGDIVAVMNPDVRLVEPLFGRALEAFQHHKRLGALGFKQLGNRDISYFLNPEYYFPVLRTIAERLTNKLNVYFSRYFFLSGAFIFFDRKKFDAVGGFDDGMFLYYEEPDIIKRLLGGGFKVYYSSKASYHHMIDDRLGFSPSAFRCLLTSLQYYFTKYGIDSRKVFARMRSEYRLKRYVARLMGRTELESLMNETISIVNENRD